jgi:hypothetical protein
MMIGAFLKLFELLKKHKLTILVGILALAVGLSAGAGAVSLNTKALSTAKPTPTATETPRPHPHPTPALTGDPSKMDISASVAESYPDPPMSSENPALPAGSLNPVSDPAFPAATNQLELNFFKRAKASCDSLKAKGAKFYSWDGSYWLIASLANGQLSGNSFDSLGAFKNHSNFDDAGPAICDPSSVNEQRLAGNTLYSSHYWLESIDGVEYLWHSHHGGPDVSTVTVYFTNGLISSTFELGDDTAWIRYGLSPLEKKSALKNY